MAFNTIKVNDADTGYVHSIFDVSEYNSGATYADFSAAIAAVPQDKRKGGMSIKFVQTDDNNYVQWRYMGTAVTGTPNPFLDIANWQGVDIEPTQGSHNLAESGGVLKSLYGINGINRTNTITLENGAVDYRNGNKAGYTGYKRCYKTPINGGVKILCSVGQRMGVTYFNGYAFYDNTGTFISGSGGDTGIETVNYKNKVIEISAPNSAAYFSFSVLEDTQTCGDVLFMTYERIDAIEKDIKDINTRIDNTNAELFSLNAVDRVNELTFTTGTIDSRDGTNGSGNDCYRTQHIPINGGVKIKCSVAQRPASNNFRGYAFYDSSNMFISGGDSGIESVNPKNKVIEIVAPSNAKYFAFSVYQDTTTYGNVVFDTFTRIDNIEADIKDLYSKVPYDVKYYSRTIITANGLGTFGLDGCIVGKFRVDENTEYVYQTEFSGLNPNIGQAVGILYLDKNEEILSSEFFVYADIRSYIKTLRGYKFTTPQNTRYVYLTISNSGSNGIDTIKNIILAKWDDINNLGEFKSLNVLVLGDSISATGYNTYVRPWDNVRGTGYNVTGGIGGWISEFLNKVSKRPINWINYAVGGYLLSDIHSTFESSYLKELEDAISDNLATPDIIMIVGCTNDIGTNPVRSITDEEVGNDGYNSYVEHTFFTPSENVDYNHRPLIPLADINKGKIIGAMRYIVERAGTVWPNTKFVFITPPQSTRKSIENQLDCVRDMKWAAARLCIPLIDVWSEAQMPMLWDYNADWTGGASSGDLNHRFLDDGIHTYDTGNGSDAIGWQRQGQYIANRFSDIFKYDISKPEIIVKT